jgi:hypothetical protein
MHATIIDACDLDAYRAWTTQRATPASIRGIPTPVWQSALGRRRRRPRHNTDG